MRRLRREVSHSCSSFASLATFLRPMPLGPGAFCITRTPSTMASSFRIAVNVVIRERAANVLEGRAELAAVILIFFVFGVGKEDKGQLGLINSDAV